MALRDDWEHPRARRGWNLGSAGMGVLRLTLLFGSIAIAMALFLTPLLDSQTRRIAHSGQPFPAGVDMMSTGSIGPRNGNHYVIRRSVLQSSPSSVCIIRENGMRSGDC